MNASELILDWLQTLSDDMHREIAGLAPEALVWQPDPGANDIAIIVWHVSRWLDVLAVRVLLDRPAEEELWHRRGWAAKTGYDPRGIGQGGLGTLTGYTPEEAEAIPRLDADELLTYFDQVCEALREQVRRMPPEELGQPAPGLGGTRTAYQWLTSVLPGCFGHVGEIHGIKARRDRLNPNGREKELIWHLKPFWPAGPDSSA